MGKKLIAGAILLNVLIALLALTVTYVFIPFFFPDYVGTPQAWAYTMIFIMGALIFFAGLLFIISRG